MRNVRIRVLGLVVMAALTAIAFTAPSASALPEWGNCIVQAQHEGKYKDSNCTSKAKKVSEKFTGEFEFVHIPKQHFTNAGDRTPTAFEAQFHNCVPSEENLPKCREGETEEVVPVTVECTEDFFKGEVSPTNPKDVTGAIYDGFHCATLGSALPCNNVKAGIASNLLDGTLGYINKATKEVGLELKPEHGTQFFKADCGGVLSITMGEGKENEGPAYPPKGGGDAMIGVVTPVNQMDEHWELALTANRETAQNVPSHFEGKGLALLEADSLNLTVTGKGTKWSPASIEGGLAEEGFGNEPCAEPARACPVEVKA